MQVGGSDQWGNITAGIDLARRMRGVQLQGITCPLLLKSDGAKMGKTESGALWLSAKRTRPYAFYQYWFNTPDADVGKCLRYFSDLTQGEVEALENRHAADPGKRTAQRQLAGELTRLVHGEEALAAALKASEILFGAEIDKVSDRELAEIFTDVPSKETPRSALERDGIPLVDALCEVGLAKSKPSADGRSAMVESTSTTAACLCGRPAHAFRLGWRVDHRAPQGEKELCPAAVRRMRSFELRTYPKTRRCGVPPHYLSGGTPLLRASRRVFG